MSWFGLQNSWAKTKTSVRRAPANRCRLVLDCLEDRRVPAGLVNATLAGGVLTLTADTASAAEDLTLTDPGTIPGTIRVTGNGGSTVKFNNITNSFQDLAGVKSIVINFKGGDDAVNVQGIHLPGSLAINGGDGGDNLTLSNGTFIGGSVSVTNGTGTNVDLDVLSINSTFIAGNLAVSQGAGTEITLVDIFGSSYIGGYFNAIGGAGNDQVKIQTTGIGTWASATGLAGDDTFELTTVSVGTWASATLADGVGTVDVVNSKIGTYLTVTTGSGSDTVTVDNSKIGTFASVSTGAGATDTVALKNSTIVGTSTTVSLGTGFNKLNLDSFSTGSSVTVTGGSDGHDVSGIVGKVGTSFTATFGSGVNNDLLDLTDFTIGGSLTANFGKGNSQLKVNLSVIGGSLTSSVVSSAFPTLNSADVLSSTFGGSVNLNMLGGNTINFLSGEVGSSINITTGAAADTIKVNDFAVGGNLNVNTGSSVDTIELGGLRVRGSVTTKFGVAGSFNTLDLNSVAGANSSLIGGNLTILGSSSVENINIGSEAAVVIGGKTTMSLGSEASIGDTVKIDDTTFLGAVALDMGAGTGTDSLLIETQTTTANAITRFFGAVTGNFGADVDQLTVGVTADATRKANFGVNPLLNGGAGNDVADMKNGEIFGTLFNAVAGLQAMLPSFVINF